VISITDVRAAKIWSAFREELDIKMTDFDTEVSLLHFLERAFVAHPMLSRFGGSAQSKVTAEAIKWYREEEVPPPVRETIRERARAITERIPEAAETVRRAVKKGVEPKRLEYARELGKDIKRSVGGMMSGAVRRVKSVLRRWF